MQLVAGVDLGGTAVNYTLLNQDEQFLIEGLCEHPALSKQGPEVCLQQIADGLKIAVDLVERLCRTWWRWGWIRQGRQARRDN